MTTQMQQYLEATQHVYEQLRLLADAEQEKRRALLDHDTDRLSELLRNQQAQMMKLEGFEKKRIQAQEEADFADLTAAQVLARLTGAERTEAEALFARLGAAAQELQELNQVAMDIADTELKMIDRLLRTSQEDANGLYTSGGKKGAGRGLAAFEEKI